MVKKSLVLLLLSIAGFAPLWAQETAVWELVTDYSNLSTNDTYVIAGNGAPGGSTWYSLKNDLVKSASTLSVGSTLIIEDNRICSTVTPDETWMLISAGSQGVYYIKSTKGNYYLQNTGNPESLITTKNSKDDNNKWKIHFYSSTSDNSVSVIGLYNIGVNREFAVYKTSSVTDWRCYGTNYYKNIKGEEVVLYRKVTSVPVSVSAVKYASFCSSCPLDFTGTGITAYKAKSDGSKVVLTAIADGIVPAKTGVVLCSPEAITFNVPVTAAKGSTDWTDNELVGITERTSVSVDGADGKTNYIFAKESSGIGFYLAAANGAYLGANRAYLSTATTATAPYLGFDDDETTDIDLTTVSGQRVTDNAYYDLSGRRVVQPTRGLYIVNGKKVVIK